MSSTPVTVPQADLDLTLTNADRRALAAVVTHLSRDPQAVIDLRDRLEGTPEAVRDLSAYVGS